ncbi:MAG TPA: hypothetical protein VKU82_15400 [Planctomycetaceae bacterium]|nr:hypothetical protein [Planctomycetaceae bacterium]
MLKSVLFSISLGTIGLALVWTCDAAAPAKIAQVAPMSDLTAEADAKVKALETSLADNQSYLSSKGTTLPADAGVLAVLAQAVAESDEQAAWKPAAADVRDAAIALSNAKSYDDAKKELEAVKAAFGGKSGGAKPEHEWNKLCRLGLLMKEVNKRNTSVKRTLRKKPQPSDAEFAKAAADSSVLAVLALAAHDDTHEVKGQKKEDIDEWQKYAKEFQAQMTVAAAAFAKKDLAGATEASKKGNAACNDCHGKFRKDE